MAINKEWLRKGAEAISEVVDAVVAAKGSHPVVAAVSLGSRAVTTYLDTFVGQEPFIGWHPVHIPCNRLVRGIIAPETTSHGDQKIAIAKLDSTRIGWEIDGSHISSPYLEKMCPITEISDRVWNATNNKLVVMSYAHDIVMASDVLTDTLPSQTAEDIAVAVEPYLDAGYHRSLLLHGIPGTGKSHIMRYVAMILGGRTLRINARALAELGSLGDILEFLKPTAVIIDDIDRAPNPGSLLGEIEVIVQSTKLFLCSANNLSKLPAAMVRVGRFSDLIEITHLDPAVIERTTATFPAELKARTQGLPISVLEDIRIRIEVEGPNVNVDALIERAKAAK